MRLSALIVLLLVFSVLVWGFAGWLYFFSPPKALEKQSSVKETRIVSPVPSPSASLLTFSDLQSGVFLNYSFLKDVAAKTGDLTTGAEPLPEAIRGIVLYQINEDPFLWLGIVPEIFEQMREKLKTKNVKEVKIANSKLTLKTGQVDIFSVYYLDKPYLQEWVIPAKDGYSLAIVADRRVVKNEIMTEILTSVEVGR